MSVLGKVVGAISGGVDDAISEQLLYDKVIGFRGIVDGVGCSTIVQNVAIAMSDMIRAKNICVVDTHILYPSQYQFLVGNADEASKKDWFDFDGNNLAECRNKTQFNNIYLLSFANRTITDMLSSKDNPKLVDDTITALKTYFDVILVDLSHEPTNISMHMALQCNQIYTVVDPSMNCISNLGKSLNYMATLAVPFGRMNKAILNKNDANVNAGVKGALNEVHLDVLGTIPNSIEIAKYGIIGKRIWSTTTNNADVKEFCDVMKKIVNDIFPAEYKTRSKYRKSEEEIATENNDAVEVDNSRTPDVAEREVEISKKEYKAYLKERKVKEKILKKQGIGEVEIKKMLDDEFFEKYGKGSTEETKGVESEANSEGEKQNKLNLGKSKEKDGEA